MNVFPVSCYSNLAAYHAAEEQHIGYIEMRDKILEFIRFRSEKQIKRILEFGAGTGLLTQYILQIPNTQFDILEPDSRCCELLLKNITINDSVTLLTDSILDLQDTRTYDIIISSFAHDHISDGQKLAYTLRRHLSPNGIYICGVELLKKFSDEQSRIDALNSWHGYVIEQAKLNGHTLLAQLEQEALDSGINKIADFKTHEEEFENQLLKAGFYLLTKKKITPDFQGIGGVFVYEWQLT